MLNYTKKKHICYVNWIGIKMCKKKLLFVMVVGKWEKIDLIVEIH